MNSSQHLASRRTRRLCFQQFERRDLLTTLELLPIADNTLYEDPFGSLSNGAGSHLFAGRVAPRGGADIRRGLIQFDLSQIPDNVIVNSVSLELNMSRTISGSQPVALHAALSDWGEAGSDAPQQEGQGTGAQNGDATWLHSSFPDVSWATAGGDFVQQASATTNVAGTGKYTWSSSQLVTDVSNWLDDPSTNFGWVILGDETSATTAKRFDTKENATPANRPKLTIDFDPADTTKPTPTISGPASPTNSDPFGVNIDFGETVNGFVAADITVSGGSVTNLVDNGNGRFTATIDAAGDGTVTVDIAAGVAADEAGNTNNAASQFSITVDTLSPTPSISGPASPTNADPFGVVIDFGEPVTGFVANEIAVTNGSVINLADSGSGKFTATIDAAADGQVTVGVAAGVATDAAGNPNNAAAQFSVTVDTVGPTPIITGPSSPTDVDPFDIEIVFGEAVNGFLEGDIAVSNGSITDFVDNGNGAFTATIDATVDGEVTIDIAAGAATDTAGNATAAAAQLSVTLDTTPPNVTPPSDITVEGDRTGGAGIDNSEIVAFIAAARANDAIDDSPMITHNAPAFFPLGATLVTFTARDDVGNTATGTATVTVADQTPPSISAPNDITVAADLPSGANSTHADIVAFLAAATASDVVDDDPVITNDAPALFPLGDTVVTFTATDAGGNSSNTTATVSVVVEAPMISIRAPGGASDPDDLPSGQQPTSWSLQRSDLREIVADFSQPISLPQTSDLVLTNLGVDADADPDEVIDLRDDQLSLSGDGLQLRITFDANQLSDGVYQLELLAAITGGDPITITGDESNGLFTLTGDWNGSGGVNIQDFSTFAYWFGNQIPTAPEYADVNGSGGINIQDFAGFAANFGETIVFPAATSGLAAASSGEGELQSQLPALLNPADVNGDGSVTPRDALNVIDEIERDQQSQTEVWSRFDTNRDGDVNPRTPLLVINRVSEQGRDVTTQHQLQRSPLDRASQQPSLDIARGDDAEDESMEAVIELLARQRRYLSPLTK